MTTFGIAVALIACTQPAPLPRLGVVKSVQIKSASQIFQSADKLETVALTKKLTSGES